MKQQVQWGWKASDTYDIDEQPARAFTGLGRYAVSHDMTGGTQAGVMYISSSQNRAFGDGVNRKDMAQIGEDFYKAIEAKVHGRREGTDPTSGFLSRRITGSLHVDHLRHDLLNADFADISTMFMPMPSDAGHTGYLDVCHREDARSIAMADKSIRVLAKLLVAMRAELASLNLETEASVCGLYGPLHDTMWRCIQGLFLRSKEPSTYGPVWTPAAS